MSINLRAARSVKKLREQMRDLAAAEHGAATASTLAAAEAVTAEQARLVATHADVGAQLARATTVYALDDIGMLVVEQRGVVATAQASHAKAEGIADLAAARLRARIRQLKTAERVVELIRDERIGREAAAEQRNHDDLNNARRR